MSRRTEEVEDKQNFPLHLAGAKSQPVTWHTGSTTPSRNESDSERVLSKKLAADAISQSQDVLRKSPSVETDQEVAKPAMSNSYGHIAATGSSRVLMGNEYHGSVYTGNVYNNQSHRYTLRQRRSDETLRETARDKILLKAAAEGQTRRVEYLIGLGADRDFADENGLTALHLAAYNGLEDTVEALLAHGVDVNALSDLYGTPICLATAKGREKVFRILLKARSNIRADAGGFGSLLHAACCGGNVEIVQDLLRLEFSIGLVCTVKLDFLEKMRSSQESPDVTVDSGEFKCASYHPLHVAIRCGRTELVSYLINNGAKVDNTYETWRVETDPESMLEAEKHKSREVGSTALMLAALLGRGEIVGLLLKQRANPNAKGNRGWSALHYAAYEGNLQCLRTLVQENAIINTVDHKGFTPIAVSAHRVHSDCVEYLAVHGADLEIAATKTNTTPLMLAAQDGGTACLRILLERGASMERRNNDGCTALAFAAQEGHANCVESLANQGADVETQDVKGWTPLHFAAWDGQLECLKILTRFGASVSVQDKLGSTAMSIASGYGHVECVKYLHSQGANLESRDYDGDTPLLKVTYFGSVAGVKALIDVGANIRAKDGDGKTALKLAKQRGRKEVVKVLEEALKR